METSELIKKVRKIEIRTRGLSKHIFSGEYHSAFKGRGMAFSEVREYQVGDDIRSIDWNVTARYNEPFVKIFEEERELTVILLVDVSGSENFGTRTQFKKELITELCSVLAFSAMQNNDKIGIIFFTDKVEKFIPPKKGKSHVLRIIRELLEFEPKGTGTNIEEALKFLSNVIKKRSIVFLMSDFIDENNFEKPLLILSKKHDTVAMQFIDKAEEELPRMSMVRVVDAETGKIMWIDSTKKYVREAYRNWWESKQKNLTTMLTRCNVDLVQIRTDQNYVIPLRNFFLKREVRR